MPDSAVVEFPLNIKRIEDNFNETGGLIKKQEIFTNNLDIG
jgi:hypothetical protein